MQCVHLGQKICFWYLWTTYDFEQVEGEWCFNNFSDLFSVAPESIHRHVKTYKQEAKNMHFVAPEYGKY